MMGMMVFSPMLIQPGSSQSQKHLNRAGSPSSDCGCLLLRFRRHRSLLSRNRCLPQINSSCINVDPRVRLRGRQRHREIKKKHAPGTSYVHLDAGINGTNLSHTAW